MAAKNTEYPALDSITRPVLPTEMAAYYPLRKPQTLRKWACRGEGPIKPVRVGTFLGWPTEDIRRLVGGAQ